jgi:phage baseplate assembly protein W|tara:strand:- start:1901 stop:2302 length:402 start_codon:yes stop_codon:yes gene_type:complete
MSSGIAAKLPLTVNNVFGAYNLITDFTSLAKQNLKMLILTAPGEKMMDINFGVGLRRYLFEQADTDIYAQIDEKIRQQVAIYLPYIQLTSIEFDVPEDSPDFYPHTIDVSVRFKIVPLQVNAILNLEVDLNAN